MPVNPNYRSERPFAFNRKRSMHSDIPFVDYNVERLYRRTEENSSEAFFDNEILEQCFYSPQSGEPLHDVKVLGAGEIHLLKNGKIVCTVITDGRPWNGRKVL